MSLKTLPHAQTLVLQQLDNMHPCICSSFLTLVLLGASQIPCVASYSLEVNPVQVLVNTDLNTVTINCSAGAVLAGCEFTWMDRFGHAGPVLGLLEGLQSQANTNSGLIGYNYSGRGLGVGDCGVTLSVQGKKEWMFGCRVRAVQGGWMYGWMELLATDRPLLPVTVSPREEVVPSGGDVNLLCRSQKPLELCWFNWGGKLRETNFLPHKSTRRALYQGPGLASGECWLTLTNVTEEDNGPASCVLRSRKNTGGDDDVMHGNRHIPLVVARPPSAPVLHVDFNDTALTATCSVGPCRPVANITWFLGDEILRQDGEDDAPADLEAVWRWPWVEASITQNLTHRLRYEDNGKRLRCVTSHVALDSQLEASEEILARKSEDTDMPGFVPSPTNNSHSDEVPSVCTAKIMLAILCEQHWVRASQQQMISCPQDEENDLCVPEAKVAAEAPKLAAEATELSVEATKLSAKATEISVEATKQSVEATELSVEATKLSVGATKLSSEATELSVEATKLSAEAIKLSVQATKLSAEATKLSAKATELSVEVTKVIAEVTKLSAEATKLSVEATKLSAAATKLLVEAIRVVIETANSNSRAAVEATKLLVEVNRVALETANANSRAEEARARKEDALAKNAEEELQFGRECRSHSLLQPEFNISRTFEHA